MAMEETLTSSLGEIAGISRAELEDSIGGAVPATMPSRPLLGALPLARIIPQDVHSVMDYVGGAALMLAGQLSGNKRARTWGYLLGGLGAVTSLLTDYRLSIAKVVPIETHEKMDYLEAATAIAAPFAFGYARKSKLAAFVHVGVGLTLALGSLLTDYRAVRGRGRGLA